MKICGKQSAVQSGKKRKLSSLASVGKEKVTVAKDNTKRGDAGLVSANFLIDALKKRAEQIGISFKEIRDLHTESKLLCCHFNSQGELLATAGHNRKHVTDVRFRPNSMVFATSSFERTVKIWNAAKPRNPFLNLVGHDEHIMSIDFYPSTAGLLSSCDSNGDIRLWDVSRGDYELILSTSVEEDQGLQIHSRSKACQEKDLNWSFLITWLKEVSIRRVRCLAEKLLLIQILLVAQTVENIVPNINPENSTYAPNHTGAKISNVMPVMPSPHLMASSRVMESIGPDLMGEMCGMLPFARNSAIKWSKCQVGVESTTNPKKRLNVMDAYEATKIVFQRIQNLDPENASKIMGILLIQDHDVEWKICYQIYLAGKQMIVAESENALRKYVPDGESEIQVRDVCCAVTVVRREAEMPHSPSATGKGSNQAMEESFHDSLIRKKSLAKTMSKYYFWIGFIDKLKLNSLYTDILAVSLAN
ncbi:uncharacterized protein LOC132636432 isoform X2 [Lycium barbarum]|nr:uncharacterized protein LOC132636432 isoform X2 [Lycium barbarum]XP_060209278.1 uncharacterized protein LOC132636432 isoform X2 [Lycium barbarum]XP_060209280.1 uncharacterized protein LOC132636432 isoform X2 [Lycium barbarum]XP_060209281.1 uncharacterized protein LOC132636432 isoform X2 [Lycium barbarum]